jgi:membrane associated rhomboid family serine protease
MEIHSRSGAHVFGPLPQLHRVLVVLTALAVGIASGAWIAHYSPLPIAAVAGALWGALAGVLLGFVLLHDFRHRGHRVRVRRQ